MAQFSPFDPGDQQSDPNKSLLHQLKKDLDNAMWRIERLEGRTGDVSAEDSDSIPLVSDYYASGGGWKSIPPYAPLYIVKEGSSKTAAFVENRSCKLWVDTSYPPSIVSDIATSRVSRWLDRSTVGLGADVCLVDPANRNYFMQDTEARQPIHNDVGTGRIYNSYQQKYLWQPTIDFDGIDDYMYLKTSLALSYPQTVFMVFNQISIQSKTTFIGATANTGYYMPGTNTSNVYLSASSLSIPVTTGLKLFMLEGKGTNNSVASINAIDNIGTLLSWTNSINQMYIGGNAANPGTYNANVGIAEIIIYDKLLTALEKDFIKEYLYRKYGVQKY